MVFQPLIALTAMSSGWYTFWLINYELLGGKQTVYIEHAKKLKHQFFESKKCYHFYPKLGPSSSTKTTKKWTWPQKLERRAQKPQSASVAELKNLINFKYLGGLKHGGVEKDLATLKIK